MDSGRWRAVRAVFDELVELEPTSRSARLAALESTDPELRRSVEALLDADAGAEDRLAGLLFDGLAPAERRDPLDPLGLVGRTLAHFRVVAPLGAGGMGVVYAAEDTRLDRAVALKLPLPDHRLDSSAKKRFLHEARVVAALEHPNLCSIYESGETADGHLFHAMPLYQGESLKARLRREGALALADALPIASQIACGLGAAHRAGIVHRDLKPGNVMLLPHDTVKILDFGLAKASDFSITGSWAQLGTVSYMAPEQVQGRDLDGRADLWALGVLLFEMLTGSRPFAGGHEVGVAHAILHDDPVRPSELSGGIPAALDDLVLTLLRKDPGKRYQSAEDVMAALAAISLRGGSPIRPRRGRVPAWARRLSWGTAALAAPVLAVLSWGGWSAFRSATPTGAPLAVAVLPFTEAGGDDAHYLAVGLAEAIRSEVSQIGGVIGPGHVTMMLYRGSAKPLSQIAAELEVAALVLGSVDHLSDRVRIEARLVDAGGEKQLWARRYDRALRDLPQLQRDVTRGILAALRVPLTDVQRDHLARPLTTRAEAYDVYLQGLGTELANLSPDLYGQGSTDAIRKAQSLYARARDLDPGFALARARLAWSHMYAVLYDTTRARRDQARLEAEIALRLQPGLPEAHEALATYWDRHGDLARAIDQTKLALGAFPNGDAYLHSNLGSRYVRAGRLEEAVAEFEEAMRLEPGSPNAAFMAALFYLRLRRNEEAMRAFNKALALRPDYHQVKLVKGHTYLRSKGISDTLAAALRDIPADWDPEGMATFARYTVLRVQRRYAEGLTMLDASGIELNRDGFVHGLTRLAVLPTSLMRAELHEALGERVEARASYATARDLLLDSLKARPRDASMRLALGLAYAGLGQRAAAVREARRAIETVPLATGNTAATAYMGAAVEVFAKAGEVGAALELLELLFTMPAGREVTVAFLRVWPGFDPLRRDPRFEELLQRFSVR